ncbi:MAG TPA: prolipoprotein diacylglyceryl transferase [Candidatus Acidoferrales bacterium]|nr:prolipoprotein diacylglyceryl transferase [Candidatus Acidoferrales bacterium]
MHPELIRIGNFTLPMYGFLAATGMVLGLIVVFYLSKRQNLDPDKMWNLAGIAVFSGILGSKLLFIITEWPSRYSKDPSDIFSVATLQSGGVFSGGLLLAIFCSWLYMRHAKLPFLRACDVFAPGIALGHAIGRLGCFSAGCCYGRPTHVPWAVTFTNPIANQITDVPLNVPLHPTQLYEFVAELFNFVVLFWLIRRQRFEGQIIGLYMFMYGIERYIVEVFRGDPGRGQLFGGIISTTQVISICLVMAGAALWMMRRPLREPALQTATAAR